MRELERGSQRFGLIVLDPPALVKSGRHLAAGARAYRELNRTAMGLLEEDGWLITCSCSHHLDDTLFRQVLLEAARAARRPMRVGEWAGAAADHPTAARGARDALPQVRGAAGDLRTTRRRQDLGIRATRAGASRYAPPLFFTSST